MCLLLHSFCESGVQEKLQAAINVFSRARVSYEGLTEERSTFELIWWQDSISVSYWTEDLGSLSYESLQRGRLLYQSQQGTDSTSKIDIKIFYHLIMEVISQPICHILLVRSKSQILLKLIIQVWTWGHSRICLPQKGRVEFSQVNAYQTRISWVIKKKKKKSLLSTIQNV